MKRVRSLKKNLRVRNRERAVLKILKRTRCRRRRVNQSLRQKKMSSTMEDLLPEKRRSLNLKRKLSQ